MVYVQFQSITPKEYAKFLSALIQILDSFNAMPDKPLISIIFQLYLQTNLKFTL